MMRFCLGCDLGNERDYTALSLVEYKPSVVDDELNPGKKKIRYDYHLRHLERIPLHTGYTEIVQMVKSRMSHPELHNQCYLAVDRTGVGGGVVEMMLREGLNPLGIYITGGANLSSGKNGYSVPKMDLVQSIIILLQSGRLHASPTLGFQKEFKEELQNFRLKTTNNGSDSAGAFRQGIHDDLVLSVCLSVWTLMKFNQERTSVRKEKKSVYNVYDSLGV